MNLTLNQIKVRQIYQAINVKNESPDASLDYLYKYVLNLVITEPFPNVLAEIMQLSLNNPFPGEDIRKIEKEYQSKLGEKDLLSADLNIYWSSIAGVIRRILTGRISGYKQKGRDILETSFFDLHKRYIFLKNNFTHYNNLYSEYLIYEKAKVLGFIYISLIDAEFIFSEISEGK